MKSQHALIQILGLAVSKKIRKHLRLEFLTSSGSSPWCCSKLGFPAEEEAEGNESGNVKPCLCIFVFVGSVFR